MVRQEWWCESWEEVVRLMSTDVFAFTLLWGLNNTTFFFVGFTLAVSSFIYLSLCHWWVCVWETIENEIPQPMLWKSSHANEQSASALTPVTRHPFLVLFFSFFPAMLWRTRRVSDPPLTIAKFRSKQMFLYKTFNQHFNQHLYKRSNRS